MGGTAVYIFEEETNKWQAFVYDTKIYNEAWEKHMGILFWYILMMNKKHTEVKVIFITYNKETYIGWNTCMSWHQMDHSMKRNDNDRDDHYGKGGISCRSTIEDGWELIKQSKKVT